MNCVYFILPNHIMWEYIEFVEYCLCSIMLIFIHFQDKSTEQILKFVVFNQHDKLIIWNRLDLSLTNTNMCWVTLNVTNLLICETNKWSAYFSPVRFNSRYYLATLHLLLNIGWSRWCTPNFSLLIETSNYSWLVFIPKSFY